MELMFGFDPTGPQAAALCILAGVSLALLMLTGFLLLAHHQREARRSQPTPRQDAAELGLVALWRMERALQSAQTPPTADGEPEAERPLLQV
ncbi:MAG: hypothetical protein ACYDAG_12555 [Chloroflexota bacterium]